MNWLKLLGMGGALAGGGAQGQASERELQNNYAMNAARVGQQGTAADNSALLTAQGQNENAKLNRSTLGISAPRDRTRQALLGSLIANARSSKVNAPAGINVGTISGGLDLDSLLRDARPAGRELTSQATDALRTKSDIPAYEDARSGLKSSPAVPGYQQAGKAESIMSLLGLLLPLAKAGMGGGSK